MQIDTFHCIGHKTQMLSLKKLKKSQQNVKATIVFG